MMKKFMSTVLVILMVIIPIGIVEATQSKSGNFLGGYTLTGNGATDVVNVALKQENRTGSQFGYTEEWCADFVSDCAKLAGQSTAIPFNGGTTALRNAIINAGGYYTTSSPQPGDICFIDWGGEKNSIDHVEIVYQVSNGKVYTIGGNSGSGNNLYTRYVRKHAPLSNTYIVSIVRPNYGNTTPPATHTHDFSVFLWCWKAHPHYNEYKCAYCDATEVNKNETNYLASCETCNHTHLYSVTATYPATCTTDGYSVYTCSCGDSYTSTYQYALGHDFSNYDYTESAHPHYNVYKCSRSGCTETSRSTQTSPDSDCPQCYPATYTVYYDANGGTGAPSSQTKTHDVSLTLSSTVPTKTYTISYNANGGSVSPSSKSVSCKFTGWNTAQNGGGTSYNAGAAYSVNGSITLYAQYATPTAGTLATPTRSGYSFDGWYTAASGGTKVTASTVISKNTTVYAHWTSNTSLSSISVRTYPSKTVYNVGESFNSSGLTLNAYYSDGTTKTITSGFTCSKPDMSTAGTKTVTVTYQGKTTSFKITVNSTTVKATSVDIYVIEEFNGTNTAKIGATVNPSNASYKSLVWTSSDTSVATVDSNGVITTYNTGVATVTVTVTNHDGTTVTDSIEVTVNGGDDSDTGFFDLLLSIFELLFLPFTLLFELIAGIF